MSKKSWHLTRRTFLRGAGVSLGLPLLEAMTPRTMRAMENATPRRLVVNPSGTRVYVTSDQSVFLGYNPATNTTFTVPVDTTSQWTGGATLSGAKVYVGGNDGAVHAIDTATNLETARIVVTFGTGATACPTCQPDLVAVRPR